MSSKEKMQVSLKDFFLKGDFNGIKPGISKDEFLAQYPKPDAFDTDPEEFLTNSTKNYPNIWTYGDIEFFFNKDGILHTIWCNHIGDFFGKLSGGESTDIDLWFLEDQNTIKCLDLIAILNENNLNFNRKYNIHAECVFISIKNGIEFSFHLESRNEETTESFKKRQGKTSFNEFTMSSFSLTVKNLMY